MQHLLQHMHQNFFEKQLKTQKKTLITNTTHQCRRQYHFEKSIRFHHHYHHHHHHIHHTHRHYIVNFLQQMIFLFHIIHNKDYKHKPIFFFKKKINFQKKKIQQNNKYY